MRIYKKLYFNKDILHITQTFIDLLMDKIKKLLLNSSNFHQIKEENQIFLFKFSCYYKIMNF